ncbi:MAG: dipicolinate synthase subunit B, partial [Clostridia bacterium]|nr:dipicolinate synthase subunit B [Clostridia bacterium]
MLLKNKKIGYGVTGSFCTFKKMIEAVKHLKQEGADIYPVMSEISYSTDTRFGTAEDFRKSLIEITGNSIIKSVKEAEPIGPKKMFDLMVVAPCTGNTLAKIANGITDTSVTMAVKAHIRNGRPVLLAVSTNDALGNSARNIGALLNYK